MVTNHARLFLSNLFLSSLFLSGLFWPFQNDLPQVIQRR
jgi:hypothetical protein